MMPFGIRTRVHVQGLLAAGIGGNHGIGTGPGNLFAQRIAIIGCIGDDFLGRGQPGRQQAFRLRAITGLARREHPSEDVALPIRAQMDLARVSAFTAPNGLFAVFFPAPVPC